RVTVTMKKLKPVAARSSRPFWLRYQQRTVSEAVAISVPAIWKPHGRALGMIALSGFIGRLLRGGRKLCGQWRRRWRYGRSGHRCGTEHERGEFPWSGGRTSREDQRESRRHSLHGPYRR